MSTEKTINSSGFRFSFNGQEKDGELKGEGICFVFDLRILDVRLGKFLSVDPLTKSYPNNAPYNFAENCVLNGIDVEGGEWELKIYGPEETKAFINAQNAVDIYKMREIAYRAINTTLTLDQYLTSSQKNNGYGGTMVLSGDGNFKAGELVYNKSAPIGLTVTTTTNNVNSTNHYSRSSSKNNPDKNYPVDIRTVNSPEYNNYYGSYDFIGIYGSTSAGSKINGATGFIEGYLKGYGFVQYNVNEIGASNGNWASSWQGGRLFGNSTTGRFDQTTLEGWGNQVSGTAEVISVGKWNSYASFGDMVNNKPSFKGVAIGFNATFSINPKKSSGLGFGVSTSFSNLVKPVKKK